MSATARVVEAPAALRTEVVRDAAGLLRLRAEWSALCSEARSGSLFLSPEWLVPWWEHFGEGREPSCIALFERERLVGFLPLFTEPVRIAGMPARRVAFLGDGATGCDYLDVLAAPGREAEVRAAALEALGRLPWDVCDLDGLLRDSSTALHLAQLFPNGRAVRSSTAGLGGAPADVVRDARLRFVCPHIPLVGSYQDYLQGLGRRENLRRREKWLLRQPGVSIEAAPRALGGRGWLGRARGRAARGVPSRGRAGARGARLAPPVHALCGAAAGRLGLRRRPPREVPLLPVGIRPRLGVEERGPGAARAHGAGRVR